MKKVKEYLDMNFILIGESLLEKKNNGHHALHGNWQYLSKNNPDNKIGVLVNNETLVIQGILLNGKSISRYGYLQTYEHIPRGKPDEFGYYARSTEEEIIQYLNYYLKLIDGNN